MSAGFHGNGIVDHLEARGELCHCFSECRKPTVPTFVLIIQLTVGISFSIQCSLELLRAVDDFELWHCLEL